MKTARTAYLALGLLVTLSLTACGNSETPVETTPPVVTTPSATATPSTPDVDARAPDAGEKVTLTNGTTVVNGTTIDCGPDSPSAIVYADGSFSCEQDIDGNFLDDVENQGN